MNLNNKSFTILLTVSTIMTFVLGLFSPFYALFVIKLGGDVEVAGLSWAIFSIVSGVLILSFNVWESSVRDKKNYMLLGIS